MTEPVKLVGFAWYRRSEWDELKRTAADPGQLAASYDSWLANASRAFAHANEQGLSPRKVEVTLEDYLAWCKRERRAPDGRARTGYVNHRLHEMLQTGQLAGGV